ncbi:hypothetical protein MHC_04195 [Mycoplasma haemocanis str. Illinois]|uniref:Uncharacterized protein n=1 Tax=Mycoplasma haemocanis (strain Illinois) TaxID=1111676 RepID=H6N7S3_MYCHN|nr:hypothetical protein [Mycoplasma haemocanis]AEW45695.1 hypothetical protein MHC_04195 [Mycoplasma haemocanis str. Illinois]
MNTLIPKVAAAVISLGGAVAVLLETKSSDNSKDLLSVDAALASIPKRRVPNKNDCNVYLSDYENVLDEKSKTSTRKLVKIEERFWTKEEFLQEVKSKNLWNSEDLKKKIEGACSSQGKRAFVWWGIVEHGKGHTWEFHDAINRENWLSKDKNVAVPEYWPEDLRTE